MKSRILTIVTSAIMIAIAMHLSSCTSLDGLIKKGNLQEAENFCEKKTDADRISCYSKLADAYLERRNRDKADEYYTKTGDSLIMKQGFEKIAESYMEGEIKETSLTIDMNRAYQYLEKVYQNEQDIHSKIATHYEMMGFEAKESMGKRKAIMEMGITSMTNRGRAINVKRAYEISIIEAKTYFGKAVVYYGKLGNEEKVVQLKKELESLGKGE